MTYCCHLPPSVHVVTVNGAPYTKATRRRIGFVLQDDVLFESLTVKVRNRWYS